VRYLLGGRRYQRGRLSGRPGGESQQSLVGWVGAGYRHGDLSVGYLICRGGGVEEELVGEVVLAMDVVHQWRASLDRL
jgi:hypothetical protein